MATQYSRILTKRSTTAGELPTIPLSNNHLDGSWLNTDIYEGEFFYNVPDKKLYQRSGSSIVQIGGVANTVSGFKVNALSITPPPLGGYIMYNNAVQSSSTVIHFSNTNNAGENVSSYLLNGIEVGSKLYLFGANIGSYQKWAITSITNNTTYVSIGVTLVYSNVSFSNDFLCTFSLDNSGGGGTGDLKADGSVPMAAPFNFAGYDATRLSKIFDTQATPNESIDVVNRRLKDINGVQVASYDVVSAGFQIYNSAGWIASLNPSVLTAHRTFQWPNASGTVALTSDIPTVAGVYAPIAGGFSFTGNVNGVTPTELTYLSGATSSIQNQINNINAGINAKISARVLSATNINLASAPASIDGVTMASGESFVANGQSTASQNGVYLYNGSGVAATRRSDCTTGGNGSTGVLGMTITIQEGTSADQIWMLSTNAPITVGTTVLTFIKSSNTTYTSSNGVTLTGNNFTLDNSYFSGAFTLSAGVATIGAGYVTNAMLASTYLTSIGVSTANGISGVSSGGATPNLTLTLGAITPTSVNGLTLNVTSTHTSAGVSQSDIFNVRNTSFGNINTTGQYDCSMFGYNVNANAYSANMIGFGSVLNSALRGTQNIFMFGSNQVLHTNAQYLALFGAYMTTTNDYNVIINPSNTVNVQYGGGNNVLIGTRIPTTANSNLTIIGDSAEVTGTGLGSCTLIGAGAKAYIDVTYGVSGGDAVAIGRQAFAGSWRTTVIGAYAQCLAVSGTAIGLGAYSNVSHGMAMGRGSYNYRGGVVFGNTSQIVGGVSVWLDNQAGTWTNPTLPETVTDVTSLNAGTYYTKVYGRPGVDAKPTPTNTNTKGGHLRFIAGPSTGTAVGGNLELAVTLAGGVSNNTENAETVWIKLDPATGVSIIPLAGTGTRMVVANSTGLLSTQTIPSGGGITRSVLTISTTQTLPATANTDYVIFISGAITVTLPTAIGNTNKYTFIKTDTGTNTTIGTTSSQTVAFYPSTPATTVVLTKQGVAMPAYSDNANWWTA